MYATIFSLQHFFQLSIKSVAAVADGVVIVGGGGYLCVYVCMHAHMPYMHTLMYTHMHVFMFWNKILCSPACLQTPYGAKDG